MDPISPGGDAQHRYERIQRPCCGWRGWLEPGMVVVAGLALTLAAAWMANAAESRHRREIFTNLANGQTDHLVGIVENLRDIELETLARFCAGTRVTPEGFRPGVLLPGRPGAGDRRPEGDAHLPPGVAEDRSRCLAAGMDDYLTKPITRAALASSLGRWLPG